MLRRTASLLATAGLVLALATGCVGEPAPIESTPGFTSEDEAFAAAEATYRAYVDALNQVDLADPSTFEPVYALTTGEANAAFRESFSRQHAEGWAVTGESTATLIEDADQTGSDASLAVCLDVSEVEVVNADGQSVVQADRRDVQPMLVGLEREAEWQIATIEERTGDPACE